MLCWRGGLTVKRTTKQVTAVVLAGAACLALTGCSSQAPKHLKSYFSNASAIMSNLGGSRKSSGTAASSESTTQATQLDVPTDFTVSEDGTYSFKGVENATQYLIYFCEPTATEDGDDYIYSSDPITDTGAESYTGKLSDVINAAYGDYLVKVFAFPDLTDTAYSMSGAAKAEYVYSGAQSDPVVDYFWNTIDGTMELVLTNVEDYTYEVYPDAVEVTFTNTEDASDVVTASIEGITADTYTATTDQLTEGATYSVTAVSKSSNEYVTNAESAVVTVADSVTADADKNVLSAGYTWSDGWASFPRLVENFPLSGGVAGQLMGSFGKISADITCTATTASAGSAYTYSFDAPYGPFTISGTLELKSDGTAALNETGGGPVAGGTVEGVWVDNGDGTATISYVPADIKS